MLRLASYIHASYQLYVLVITRHTVPISGIWHELMCNN